MGNQMQFIRIFRHSFFKDFSGAVNGAVIDKNNFIDEIKRIDCFDDIRQGRFFIQNRNQKRDTAVIILH